MHGLEGIDEQVAVFDSIPMPSQVALLRHALAERDYFVSRLEPTIQAWLKRDLAALWRVSEDIGRRFPDMAVHYRELTTRVVPLGGRVSVIAECRVKPRAFAKAVDLDPDDVGAPVFVFEAVIENGQARAGGQRGLRFRPDAPVGSLDLSPYAAAPDAAGLAVVFRAD